MIRRCLISLFLLSPWFAPSVLADVFLEVKSNSVAENFDPASDPDGYEDASLGTPASLAVMADSAVPGGVATAQATSSFLTDTVHARGSLDYTLNQVSQISSESRATLRDEFYFDGSNRGDTFTASFHFILSVDLQHRPGPEAAAWDPQQAFVHPFVEASYSVSSNSGTVPGGTAWDIRPWEYTERQISTTFVLATEGTVGLLTPIYLEAEVAQRISAQAFADFFTEPQGGSASITLSLLGIEYSGVENAVIYRGSGAAVTIIPEPATVALSFGVLALSAATYLRRRRA